MLMFVIQHQPYSAGTDLRRKLVACLIAHGSILSRVGASGKPGAVQAEVGDAHRVAELIAADLASTKAFNWIGTAITIRDVFGKTLFAVRVDGLELAAT